MLFTFFGTRRRCNDNPRHTNTSMRFGIGGIVTRRRHSRAAVTTPCAYSVYIIVSELGNDNLCLIYITTARYGARPTPCQTGFCARRLDCIQNFDTVMLGTNDCADNFLISANFTFHIKLVNIFNLSAIIGRFQCFALCYELMYRFILFYTTTIFTAIIVRFVGYKVFGFIIMSRCLTVSIFASGAFCRSGTGIAPAAVCSTSGLNTTTGTHFPVMRTIIQIITPSMVKRSIFTHHFFAATTAISI